MIFSYWKVGIFWIWRIILWSPVWFIAYFLLMGFIFGPLLTYIGLDREARFFAEIAFPKKAIVVRKYIEYTPLVGDPVGTWEFHFTDEANSNYRSRHYMQGLDDSDREEFARILVSIWPDISTQALHDFKHYNDGLTFPDALVCTPKADCEFFLFWGEDRAYLHVWHI